MKNWHLALAAFLLSASTAHAQGFENIKVPGIGPITATVDFSPSSLSNNCELMSRFPAGQKITTPFVIYVIANRTSTGTMPVKVTFRWILPNGGVAEVDTNQFTWTHITFCNNKQINRVDAAGTHRFQWFYNDVEIGRATLDVN